MKQYFLPLLLCLPIVLFLGCEDDDDMLMEPVAEVVTDVDGNVYQTIQLGNQTWMLENLKTTTFNDGTPIDEWTFGESWTSLNDPISRYQLASTDGPNNTFTEDLPEDYYGAVYNHFALESGNLAPEGWRIPTEEDFKVLEAYVASQGYAGQEAEALKSATGWLDPSQNGTDVIGFKGLPNGYVTPFGTSTATGLICIWATSEITEDNRSRRVVSLFNQDTIGFVEQGISLGAGVRCIKE